MEVHTNMFQDKSALESQVKVKQNILDSSEYMKVHTNVLQDEILKLKSQLEIQEKLLEKSENVKVFTNLQEECSGLKSQLEKQVNHLEELEEENFKLTNQLEIIQKQLKNLEVEKKQYIDKYSELKDKERCDIAIQTDTVCIVIRNIGSYHKKCLYS